eukprot:465368_1
MNLNQTEIEPTTDCTDELIKQKVDNLKIEISKTTPQHPTINDEEKGFRSPSTETPRDNIIENTYNKNLLILLDWDDTLFPTSFIVDLLKTRNSTGFVPVTDEHISLLHKLGTLTLKFLTSIINKYSSENIHIVSNSVDGWIKESLLLAGNISESYKQIDILLTKNKITMDSAQTMYAENNSLKNSTPILWKQFCFSAIINSNRTKTKTKTKYNHILSIGDQWIDHHAVKQMIETLNINSSIHHIIKLKSTPNVNDMINEMLYIQALFNQIFHSITSESIQPIVVDYHIEETNHYKYQNKHK